MTVHFRRAQRQKAKLRLALAGPAGSGKTYSALLIAFGLGGRVALVDTERGSGELYSHLGEYDVCSLKAPFTPEKYIEAIRAAEDAGYDTVIIDSLSHAWAGPGGVLDIHGHLAQKCGNSWAAWRLVTPRHNDLVDAMLLSGCHIIATLRSKMEHVQVEENGRTVVKKVGTNLVQRDGLEYEFTVLLDLDQSHMAQASKDRTSLFDGQVFKPTPGTGQLLKEWLESGAGPDKADGADKSAGEDGDRSPGAALKSAPARGARSRCGCGDPAGAGPELLLSAPAPASPATAGAGGAGSGTAPSPRAQSRQAPAGPRPK